MSEVPQLSYDQLLIKIIDGGIKEVKEAYANSEDHHKRDGAIEGFEACRGKTPDELVQLYQGASLESQMMVHKAHDDPQAINEYWKARYYDMQIEFVLNVLSVALDRPLLGHLPTFRGAQRYARILAEEMGMIPP